MDYGRLFSRAWEICWGHKWLFLLGFLAALGAGGSGGGSSNFSFPSDFSFDDPATALPPDLMENIEQIVAVAVPILIGLACAAILIGIALWLLRLTAQAGMISTVQDAESGEKVSLGQAFSKGVRYMPRLLGINILLILPILLLVFVMSIIAFALFGASIGVADAEAAVDEFFAGVGVTFLALACLFACVIGLYSLFIALLEPLAQRSAVLEDRGVINSLRHAWQTLTGNLGDVLILAVLYVVIGFIYGFIVTIVLIPFGLIVAGPTLFDFLTTGEISTGGVILAGIGGIILVLVAAVLNAIWVTFRSVSFTLACREWFGKALKPAQESMS